MKYGAWSAWSSSRALGHSSSLAAAGDAGPEGSQGSQSRGRARRQRRTNRREGSGARAPWPGRASLEAACSCAGRPAAVHGSEGGERAQRAGSRAARRESAARRQLVHCLSPVACSAWPRTAALLSNVSARLSAVRAHARSAAPKPPTGYLPTSLPPHQDAQCRFISTQRRANVILHTHVAPCRVRAASLHSHVDMSPCLHVSTPSINRTAVLAMAANSPA